MSSNRLHDRLESAFMIYTILHDEDSRSGPTPKGLTLFLFNVASLLALVASLIEHSTAGPSTTGGGTIPPMLATLASFSGARDSSEHTENVEDASNVIVSAFNTQAT
jgi:hypothetical protein